MTGRERGLGWGLTTVSLSSKTGSSETGPFTSSAGMTAAARRRSREIGNGIIAGADSSAWMPA
jgi:hypothetical protein